MTSLDKRFHLLRDMLNRRNEDCIVEANEIISSIALIGSDDSLIPLLRLFDDDAPESIMFSLLHAVESWNDAKYCNALLEVLEDLWMQAPRWTMIIHIRVLNNPKTFIEYSAKASACSTRLATIRHIFSRISSEWPQLKNKVNDALERLHE